MKIKNYDAGFLTVFDETREISFLDLAKISGYQIDTNLEHCWVLYCVRELLKDKSITFNFDTSYYLDGSISEISYGYFINHINRRVIRLSKDGTVDSDYIILFDPRYIGAAFYYYASIPGKIKLENYLSDEDHYYKNYNEKETISNQMLSDDYVQEYFEKCNRYCNLLNYFCDDSNKLEAIFKRYNDNIYIDDLEREIRRKKALTITE